MRLGELSNERLADENELMMLEPSHPDAVANLIGAIVHSRVRDLISVQMGKKDAQHLVPLAIAKDLGRWLQSAGMTTAPPSITAPLILQIVHEKCA